MPRMAQSCLRRGRNLALVALVTVGAWSWLKSRAAVGRVDLLPRPVASISPGLSDLKMVHGTVVTQCTVNGTIAITFDDGPGVYTKVVVDALNAAGIKATFFVNGINYDCAYAYADLLRDMDAAGHLIAAHTYSHPDLTSLTATQVSYEMAMNGLIFQDILGKVPAFMRPPYGNHNDAVDAVLGSLGYTVVMWTLDSGDSWGLPLAEQQANINGTGPDKFRVATGEPFDGGNRYIVLNHDVLQSTATELVPWIIKWIKASGLRAVTVAECLGYDDPASWYRDFATPIDVAGRTCPPTPTSTPTASHAAWVPVAPGTVVTQCTVNGTVAITFDDGPGGYTQGIVDDLNDAGISATFFVNGLNEDCVYDHAKLLQSMDAGGHQIAAHTYSHADLSFLTETQVSYEMAMNGLVFQEILGKVPAFMRPPYGSHNGTVDAVLGSLGYVVVMWTQDSGDSIGADFPTQQANYLGTGPDEYKDDTELPYNGGNRFIFLNHDVQPLTATKLVPWIIKWVKTSGLRAVTVAECLGYEDPKSWYRDYAPPIDVAGRKCPPTPTNAPTAVDAAESSPALAVAAAGTVVRQCTVNGTIALTFDDGPWEHTKAIVDALDAADMRATFFVNGLNYNCIYDYAELLQDMDAAGHLIAAHTYSHLNITTLSSTQLTLQMSLNSAALQEILGKAPTYMRPPYGSYDAASVSLLQSLGFTVVMWTLDSGDSGGLPLAEQQANVNGTGPDKFRVATGEPFDGGNRYIVLNHDVLQSTATELVPWIIKWVKASGLRAVTVAECLGYDDPASWYRDYVPRANVTDRVCLDLPSGA